MKFWDSSALVPLLVGQTATEEIRKIYAGDPQAVAWMMSEVEFVSAVHRLVRDGALGPDDSAELIRRFDTLWSAVHQVTLVDGGKRRARRLLGIHPLRAADALQLGAALTAASDDPTGWDFVGLDRRLNDAARREGFRVRP